MLKYALNYLKKYKEVLKLKKIIWKDDKYIFFEYFQKWLKQLNQINNDSYKKGIIIYGPRGTDKTLFCQGLIGDIHTGPFNNKYIIYNGVNISKSGFDNKKTTAKLIIMDNMELTDFNLKIIKGLLSNQIMHIIDQSDNWYIKLPIIIITNSFETFNFYLNNDEFKKNCYIIACNSYLGPKGTQPERKSEIISFYERIKLIDDYLYS